MVRKTYEWENGAELEDHTKKKHDILRDYFRRYLIVRCRIPKQEKFRLAIVDGFSGGGLYKCGSYGSPLIFVDVLIKTLHEINLKRVVQGIKPINIECLLILNDYDDEVVGILKKNIAPFLVAAKEAEHLNLSTQFSSGKFENISGEILKRLAYNKLGNAIFNLDQCGYSNISTTVIRDIMQEIKSPEIILTFVIEAMMTYLSPHSKKNQVPIEKEVKQAIFSLLESKHYNKAEWLGEAEKVVFDHLKSCARFVSPFSIKNPDGWRYWLMHFSKSYRARQEYNNVQHQSGAQAHFGRAGLDMLSYDPRKEGQLYLFDEDSRTAAKNTLYDDIPRFVSNYGDAILLDDFYASIYSKTPAHSDDIHEMMIANPDIEIFTPNGGKRKQPNTIKSTDIMKLKSQKSFFFTFPDKERE